MSDFRPIDRGTAYFFPPLLSLLIYGYATRVISSRAIERAIYDSAALRFIAANEHPDHETIASFRTFGDRHLISAKVY